MQKKIRVFLPIVLTIILFIPNIATGTAENQNNANENENVYDQIDYGHVSYSDARIEKIEQDQVNITSRLGKIEERIDELNAKVDKLTEEKSLLELRIEKLEEQINQSIGAESTELNQTVLLSPTPNETELPGESEISNQTVTPTETLVPFKNESSKESATPEETAMPNETLAPKETIISSETVIPGETAIINITVVSNKTVISKEAMISKNETIISSGIQNQSQKIPPQAMTALKKLMEASEAGTGGCDLKSREKNFTNIIRRENRDRNVHFGKDTKYRFSSVLVEEVGFYALESPPSGCMGAQVEELRDIPFGVNGKAPGSLTKYFNIWLGENYSTSAKIQDTYALMNISGLFENMENQTVELFIFNGGVWTPITPEKIDGDIYKIYFGGAGMGNFALSLVPTTSRPTKVIMPAISTVTVAVIPEFSATATGQQQGLWDNSADKPLIPKDIVLLAIIILLVVEAFLVWIIREGRKKKK